MLSSPVDWSAHVLQGGLPAMKAGRGRHKWARSTGFFATPMDVCTMMTEMLYVGVDREEAKVQSVCDPCVGTGSMLLVASNYSLRLFGQDIVPDLVLCCKLNGYLWAPWMVCMPGRMRELLSGLGDGRGWGVPGRVAATAAYRAGEIGQLDFFEALGVK